MGDYNPHTPYILGQEWVGIRDETLTFEPTVNTVEQGYRFILPTATQVSQARVYINDVPPNGAAGTVVAVGIYPAGTAEDSGPIRTVDVPVSSVSISGDTPAGIASVTVSGAPTALGAIYAEGLDSSILFGAQVDFRWITCLFDISRFAGLIKDKRILNVQLVYTATCPTSMIETDPQQNFGIANSIFNTNVNLTPNASPFSNNTPFLGRIIAAPDTGYVADLGELNYHFGGQLPTANLNQAPDRMNWSYAELIRMAGLASTFIYVVLGIGSSLSTMNICFVSLRITYCEEKRTLYGATAIGTSFSNAFGKIAVPGAFIVPLRSVTTMAANTVLPAGSYDVVVSSAQQATPLTPVNAFPSLNALRELYSMPAHPPIKIRIPFPLDTAIGQTFEEQTTTILPQLSLHTTGGTIVAPHAYGRQVAAQVYGANTAIQDIYDVPIGGAANFPQVRYYARRYGDTDTPLTLESVSPLAGLRVPGTAGNYASTPDNAALDIVGDIDIRADVTITDWSAAQVLVAKYTTGTNQRSYRLETFGGGLSLTWSSAGTGASVLFASSTLPVTNLVVNGGRLAVRATLDVDNGAGGWTATFYTSDTINGTWTQLGDAVTTAGVTSIFSGTAVLEVGTSNAGADDPTNGTFYAVEVRNGIGGTAVANPIFSAQAAGTPSFVDAAGRTWTMNGTAAITAGLSATVSITPSEFDALDTIVDGWKNVTLRFASPPNMGALTGVPRWMWSSVGETAGNRWEVLGVSSHAITALPSNALSLVASPNATSVATYGTPVSGSVVDLDWMPGLAPLVTGTADDPSADAVLIFSQDPATITGFAISLQSQAVTGFVECTRSPCCVPSAISYHRVTWSASTLPVTGFGAYELQRQDIVDGVWETIMMATDITVTGFNDYEARVGVLSSYQIRQTNVLDFAGAWSVTGTGTITEPGVTLPSCGASKRGVLIFTTNEVQDGSRNLAYAMTWDDTPTEDFDFNEAGTIDIQRHHDRDFQVAFHGSERGGETFSRRLLLSNAAIALPRLGDTHSLRDLAWDDLSYVCVRDDIGDRWLSTVIVPRAEVRRNRRLYNADITVIEVTDTPSPVNP